MNYKGSFNWDKFFGTFITVDNINTYELTPAVYNYVATSRATSAATASNVTVTPKNAASYDDTYNLAKCTATGSSPSVSMESQAGGVASDPVLQQIRISGSVWLKADADNDPGTITLTMTDGSDLQSVSTTITNSGVLQRYGISGYFDNSETTIKLKVSWTSTTGVVYLDGWQIENNDWPSETIVNTTSNPILRQVYANADRVHSLAAYKYGQRITWNEIATPDHIMAYDQIGRAHV